MTAEMNGNNGQVRYHDPDVFETVNTSERPKTASGSIAEGRDLRIESQFDSNDWGPQPVLIPGLIDVKDKTHSKAALLL